MTNSTIARPSEIEDKHAIRKLTEDWLAAVRRKDIPTLLTMITEDVVFLPPGHPPISGRPAVEAMYAGFFPQFSSVEQTAATEEIVVAGDWAFAWGSETLTLVPQAGTAPIQMHGKGMSILRRQSDGSWKFARGINNLMRQTAQRAR